MDRLLERLSEHLDEKIQVLSELIEFDQKQLAILSSAKSVEEIDASMIERDNYAEKILILNDKFASIYNELTKNALEVANMKSNLMDRIREKNQRVADLESQVTSLEKENRTVVDSFMQDQKKVIRNGRQTSRAAYGYYQNMSGAGGENSRLWDSKY